MDLVSLCQLYDIFNRVTIVNSISVFVIKFVVLL